MYLIKEEGIRKGDHCDKKPTTSDLKRGLDFAERSKAFIITCPKTSS